MIKAESRAKERLLGQQTQFFLALPKGRNQAQEADRDAAAVYIEVEPGQFSVYLHQKTAAALLGLEQQNYSLTIPTRVILQMLYQGYLQGGLQYGVTFCGYYVEADQITLFTRTLISLDGDVINLVKRSFVANQNCLDMLAAYHWLYWQLLRQIQNLLNATACSLAGFVTLFFAVFQGGSRWLQRSDSLLWIFVWFWLSGLSVLGFWLGTEKTRSRLFQFLNNRLSHFYFPRSLSTLPWQIASASSSLGLIFWICQDSSSLVWSLLLLPCLYHIFRTRILPMASRWLLAQLLSSRKWQRVIRFLL